MKVKCKNCGRDILTTENLSQPYICGECFSLEVENNFNKIILNAPSENHDFPREETCDKLTEGNKK